MGEDVENLIGKRFSSFLGHKTAIRNGLIAVVSDVRRLGLEGFVFGGVIRDILFKGPRAFPRDVDLVFERKSFDVFAREFAQFIVHRNRFGGLYLKIGHVDFDVWPLDETWAFKNCSRLRADFQTLPDTTFLSIDAIAVELAPKKGAARRIYENRFFHSIETKTIDINLRENPFPALCIVRSLVMSHRLQYRLTDRLAEYILNEFPKIGLHGLEQAILKHYDHHVVSWELLKWLFARQYDGPSDFNRTWAEANHGFRRQEVFDWLGDWRLKETHLFVEQLWLPGIIEWDLHGPWMNELDMRAQKAADYNY